MKLADSGFVSRKAVLVYGFDDEERPLADAVDALDLPLRSKVRALDRFDAEYRDLRHPGFSSGRVVAWEIFGPAR